MSKSRLIPTTLVLLSCSLSGTSCSQNTTIKFSAASEKVLSKLSVLDNPGTAQTKSLCNLFMEENQVVNCGIDVRLPDGTFQDRRTFEKARALTAASADPQHILAVELVNYMGTKMDILAQSAHQKSITAVDRGMYVDSNGKNFSPVGMADKYSTGTDYYKGDHSTLLAQYKAGQVCFYGNIRIDEPLVTTKAYSTYSDYLANVPTSHASLPDQNPVHAIQYLNTGYCGLGPDYCANNNSLYGPGYYAKNAIPHRLFGPMPHYENIYENGVVTATLQPQMVAINVADFRSEHLGLDTTNESIITVAESTSRGSEMTIKASDFIKLNTVLLNAKAVIQNLSHDYISPETGLKFSALSGVEQQLANLCSTDAAGVAIATQYTPIVLDLGDDGIYTTNIHDGVSFDMAADGVKRSTAWVGGKIVTADAVNKNGVPFKKYVTLEAEDGFLVIPVDGKITSSKQLFGANLEYDGKKYGTNGFEALIAIAGKNCRSNDLKERFVGPWDSQYHNLLKVWIDKNRNGIAEPEEIKSLADAGVAAIDACYTAKHGMKDSYGNETELRSLIVKQSTITATEDDILNLLKGEPVTTLTGVGLTQSLAIDIIFKGAK